MTSTILKTNQLTKTYKHIDAVSQVNMTVNKGDVYGFIGKNGAGKTTFIRMITGLIEKSNGTLYLENNGSLGNLGAVIEGPACYPYLSAKENLHYFAIQQGIKSKKREREVLDFVGLKDTGKKPFKDFSLGMKQRLGIGIAILSKPKFLILDEPINGLDPEGIIEIRTIIQRLNQEQQTTIFISSHILAELSMVANRYGVINKGKLIREFTKEELAASSQSFIHLDTTNNLAAYQVLADKYEVEKSNDKLCLVGESEEKETIGQLLLKEAISIKELYSESTNLEDYFLEITGGKEHV